jgi:CRISPR-associated exonuclease Cas4
MMDAIKITPTELLEYYFCPRFIYFMNVLKIPQYEDRRYKVQKGREVHQQRQERNKDYLWKKIDVVARESNVHLICEKYHLHGIVDEVVTLKDHTLAPIDYKYAIYPQYVYRSHRMQILSYCLLIEEVYQQPVNCGFLFYIREGSRQVKVPYNAQSRQKIIQDLEQILRVIQNENIPAKTNNWAECIDCTYKNICV